MIYTQKLHRVVYSFNAGLPSARAVNPFTMTVDPEHKFSNEAERVVYPVYNYMRNKQVDFDFFVLIC